MTHRQLIAIATAVAALTLVAPTLTGTASAAAKDWHSSDGVCYTSGWCHWSEACYDAFGGCYFDSGARRVQRAPASASTTAASLHTRRPTQASPSA